MPKNKGNAAWRVTESLKERKGISNLERNLGPKTPKGLSFMIAVPQVPRTSFQRGHCRRFSLDEGKEKEVPLTPYMSKYLRKQFDEFTPDSVLRVKNFG